MTLLPSTRKSSCNCRQRDSCPLQNNCLNKNMVYQASVKNHNTNKIETYIGLCATDFKSRYSNHKASFKHKTKQNQTELSKHIWQLKEKGENFTLTWKKIAQAQPYNNKTKKCNLCLLEKLYIICKPHLATINKRQELSSTCRHAKSYLLSHIT